MSIDGIHSNGTPKQPIVAEPAPRPPIDTTIGSQENGVSVDAKYV